MFFTLRIAQNTLTIVTVKVTAVYLYFTRNLFAAFTIKMQNRTFLLIGD